jgi:glutathione S-transferase
VATSVWTSGGGDQSNRCIPSSLVAYDEPPLTPSQSPEFLKINPNGRIPAIIDDNYNGKNVWESAAILLWLGNNYGASRSHAEITWDRRL